MNKYSSYLVCGEHINEVKDFLRDFFKEEKGKYNFENWVTFKTPDTDFVISLMGDADEPLTQNMTFEITPNSFKELEEFAKKYNKEIQSFVATSAPQKYRYHYLEIQGPRNICKMEINFCEDLE